MCFRFTPLAVFLFLFHRHIIERRECVRDCRRQCCCPCPAAYASAAPVLPDRVRGDCDGIIGGDITIQDSDKVSITLRSAPFRCSGDPVPRKRSAVGSHRGRSAKMATLGCGTESVYKDLCEGEGLGCSRRTATNIACNAGPNGVRERWLNAKGGHLSAEIRGCRCTTRQRRGKCNFLPWGVPTLT